MEQLKKTVIPLLSLLQALNITNNPREHTHGDSRQGTTSTNPDLAGPNRELQPELKELEVEAPVSLLSAGEQRQRILDSLCALISSCASAMAMEILDGERGVLFRLATDSDDPESVIEKLNLLGQTIMNFTVASQG